jgi:hypothetical protein
MAEFIAWNGALPTTAAFAKVTTGTAIKTLLQVGCPTTRSLHVVEWGISFDGSAAGTPITCELIETGAIGATVTAHTTSTIAQFDSNDGILSQMTFSTTTTGYTATAEGSIVATRLFDCQLVAPTSGYKWQFPIDERPKVGSTAAVRIVRVRVTAAAAVNAVCYILWDEH